MSGLLHYMSMGPTVNLVEQLDAPSPPPLPVDVKYTTRYCKLKFDILFTIDCK